MFTGTKFSYKTLAFPYANNAWRLLIANKLDTMNFTFGKNIHFTKLVKTYDRLREFNFRKLPGKENETFHVDVPDDRGNRIIFKMEKHDRDQWRIVEQHLPAWISEHEQRLNDLIEEEIHE